MATGVYGRSEERGMLNFHAVVTPIVTNFVLDMKLRKMMYDTVCMICI